MQYLVTIYVDSLRP